MLTRNLDIEGPAGRIEAVLMTPDGEPVASALLCHAHPLHGGSMHFKLLFRVAKVLQSRRYAVLRFHFRGVGRSEGAFDDGRGETEDARAALESLSQNFPGKPVVVGGFSFGAAVSLRAGVTDERVSALILMGLPVSASTGLRPENSAAKPILIVQGERDEFGNGEAIESFVKSVPGPVDLVIVPGADHFFNGRIDEVEAAVAGWLEGRGDRLP